METAASQAGSEIRSYKGREGREIGITEVGEEGRWGLRGWRRKEGRWGLQRWGRKEGRWGYRVGEEVVGEKGREIGLQGWGGRKGDGGYRVGEEVVGEEVVGKEGNGWNNQGAAH